jgi:hypothetical protein
MGIVSSAERGIHGNKETSNPAFLCSPSCISGIIWFSHLDNTWFIKKVSNYPGFIIFTNAISLTSAIMSSPDFSSKSLIVIGQFNLQ